MNNIASSRRQDEFRNRWYPAFSRRATQVCILSSAMERIALGTADPAAVARAALDQADPFGWKSRNATAREAA